MKTSNNTRKIIAEDSHGTKFYLSRDDSKPKEKRYTIIGGGVMVEADSIPYALTLLKAIMKNQGKLLVTFEALDPETVIVTQKDGK